MTASAFIPNIFQFPKPPCAQTLGCELIEADESSGTVGLVSTAALEGRTLTLLRHVLRALAAGPVEIIEHGAVVHSLDTINASSVCGVMVPVCSKLRAF